MQYIGKSMRPLNIIKDGETINPQYCEFYRCKICEHIEWKATNGPQIVEEAA